MSAGAPRLPNRLPRPPGELEALEAAWSPPRGWRLLSAVNNTQVGRLYIATALLFFLAAGVLALVIRAQLALPESRLVDADTYNQLFTMHGTVMMFLFAVPVVEAIAVYLLPAMLGARDLPFPRLGAYAFWAYAIGGAVFFCTIFFGASPDGGWFMYPPLTGKLYSPGVGADWWLLGIGFIEISAIAGAIELIVGILFTRAPGMTLARMPVFAWAMLVTALMIVFAFPAIIAGTLLLELERAFDWPFFIAARGGDPLLWQHLFWFFGHPEVYIIFLPAAGLVSMMVASIAGVPLAGRGTVVIALAGVGLISFALWLHHMFTAGLGSFAASLASAASLAVAIPSGVQVIAWIVTLWRGQVRAQAPTLFVVGFLAIFVLGGLTGVMLAVLPFDWQAHDSMFIVAHLHYVLIGGMVFPVFAAFYHWAPLLRGHRLSERVARWVFALMFGGFNLAFFPMHFAGLQGMPRRVWTYPADAGWTSFNLLSTIGAFVFAAGVLLFAADVLRMLRRPRQEPGNPWHAPTLEWLPQGEYGTRSIAQVASAEPLWAQPSLPQEVQAGAHWLPGTVAGGRETIVTSPRLALPRQLLRLPGDSWLPFIAAAGTAGFFLLLTVAWIVSAFACAAVALAAIVAWLWETDRSPPAPRGLVAEGVALPFVARGAASHAWWAMAILVAVDATVFLSLAFAHLHVGMAAETCPPPGAALPPAREAWFAAALLLLSSAAMGVAQRLPRRSAVLIGLVALALATLLGACLVQGIGWREVQLGPMRDAWSATVAALLAWQGAHMAALLVMALYLVMRAAAGLVRPDAPATLSVTAFAWHAVTAECALTLLLFHRLPAWVG